jgi:hypothetical protein
MGEAIDQLAMALASGTSRRAALAGVLAGATSLPWTAAGRRRHRNKKFKKYLGHCRIWCGHRFPAGSSELAQCIAKAKDGKGACFAEGPGHFCLALAHCGKHQVCCPFFLTGDPVTDGECCAAANQCAAPNGTAFVCVSM